MIILFLTSLFVATQYLWIRDCTVSPEYGGGQQIIDKRGYTLISCMSVCIYSTQNQVPYINILFFELGEEANELRTYLRNLIWNEFWLL